MKPPLCAPDCPGDTCYHHYTTGREQLEAVLLEIGIAPERIDPMLDPIGRLSPTLWAELARWACEVAV